MGGNFGTPLEQRLTPSIASSQQLLDFIMQKLRVAVPAIVYSFDPMAQTVSVIVATRELVFKNGEDPALIDLSTQAQTLPLLTDVPIHLPGAGLYTLTFPIQKGDECMVVFQDTAIDSWFQAGAKVVDSPNGPQVNNNPVSQRRHSLSDAIAVFGIRSRPRALTAYSTTAAQLRSQDGTVLVELNPTSVRVHAATVNIEGSDTVNITGANSVHINGSGDTIIDGKNFLSHAHGGVQSGGSVTGPVV